MNKKGKEGGSTWFNRRQTELPLFKINKKKKIGYFTVTLILKLFFYNLMTRLALPGIKLPAPPGDQHGNITRTQNFEHEISSGSSG